MTASLARDRLAQVAARHGLDLVGVTDASPLPEDRERMASSVAAGRMGLMGWMGGERPVTATDPRRHGVDVRSLVVVAVPYAGADRARWDARPDALREALAPVLAGAPAEPAGRIARYALGTDYHPALRARLQSLAAELRTDGAAYVDDRPLAERALAARAGLGWIGKNTNLLTHARAGSWVFLGALLTSAELEPDEPIRTTCGSCTRCLSGCPTGALVAPQTIDARRCISYLTIERPGTLETWEAEALGDWIFGCDVCQEVCPVNVDADDSGPLLVPLLPLIDWLLPLGRRAFDRAVGESAVRRAGRHRLLRNAIVALGNAARGGRVADADRADARALLGRATRDARDEVREQASGTLAQLA
ncbi:MAG: tRNA epoxyqueuosine(34) reductase QueG [Candidatus Limnocylindria bacterium]